MGSSELRKKPKQPSRLFAWILVIAWAALIFALSAIPGSGYPSHPGFLNIVAHFCEYFILAVLLARALGLTKVSLWKVALIALILASLYAVSDEFHQFYVPGRSTDPMDWLVDTIGALVGAVVMIFYLSAQRVKRSRKRDGE